MKNTISVFFPESVSQSWLGGLNYYNNLFTALKILNKTASPAVIPYIFQQDNAGSVLLSSAEILKIKKTPWYYFQKKMLCPLLQRPFDMRKYAIKKNKFIDAVSHADVICNKPLLLWIADFQHIHLPDMFTKEQIDEREKNTRIAVEHAKVVILSSYDALNDFKQKYPEYAQKGRVLHFTAIPEKDIYRKTDILRTEIILKYKLPDKYFYCPNQFWKHKNHKTLFQAVAILKKRGVAVDIICSGNTVDVRNPTYFAELQQFIEKNDLQNSVHVLGIIDRMELFYLMRNCIAIINPSLFEGWSSTVEEAKSIGKNCILSNLQVHQEQAPAESLYFDPLNAEELANILEEQWETGVSAPNKFLEEQAKAQLSARINEFGETYRKILFEALEIK